MTPEQFQQFLIQNERSTGEAIEKFVNGKIRAVDAKVEEIKDWTINHAEGERAFQRRVEDYMVEMLPVKDGVHTIQSINKFLRWLGLPALGALIAWLYIK